MYLKRLLAFLCCFTLVFCLFPSSAFATGGNGNIDGGGGSMGHGTSSNFWNSGNDGVRITVVDASSGTAVSSPLDFSNRTQKTSLLHFGKVNKLQYLGGAGLSLQSGAAYSCIRPTQSMPTIVSSKGQSNIEAIKRYFCSEYACMMLAQAAGVDYERMIAGEYKLLIEPIAYFTHNGQYYCMTATEAGLYDQMSGGNLRKTMTSLTHKNLPLSMFLEFSDLGISAWTGSTTGKQNNSDIISTLGVGIVWFDEAPPEGEIETPDVEYRVDTDVITAVTLRTDQDLTPDNPASVTFHILGTTYRVNDIVIPAGDSQVVWVKWHTPSTPQTVTITVSVSGAYTAQDTFVAKIVDLNEHIPPDPVATDTNPGYSVPTLPNETQKLTANWGVWSCYWVPVWVWCDHGEDGGHWVDEGYWEYEYTGYSASISGEMSLMPDDIVPTASGKTMKSGYGVKTEVRATLSTDAPTSHITYPQTAFSVFPEFQYQTYLRLLQRSGGQSAKFIFKPNEFSTYDRTVHFTPLWFPDATDYTIYTQVWDTWTPDGMLSINLCCLLFKYPEGHNQFFFRMLLFTVENTANTVCKLPVGGSAPPKDRAAAAVASVVRRIWLIRYGTVKALRVYQRNVPYLPDTFRAAVIQYLQLRSFPKRPAQLVQVFNHALFSFPRPAGQSCCAVCSPFLPAAYLPKFNSWTIRRMASSSSHAA